jgi:Putative bacterial sensory transduction regulator
VDDAPARIARYLEQIGAEAERRGEREWGVRLPSAKRGAIGASVSVRERTLTIRAFVLRGPDRAHEDVYRHLLRKNLATSHWRFAIDDDGDVYLICDAPLAALDADALDGLLGSLCSVVDETYEGAVRTGFDVPEGTEFRPPPGE